MQKQKRLKINYRFVLVAFFSLSMILILALSAQLLVAARVCKSMLYSATKVCSVWSEFFSKSGFSKNNMPQLLALDAELFSNSDFSDVKLNMSYNSIDVKFAASLYGSCADGTSKELFVFVDKSCAGISFEPERDKYYTIPSKTFASGVGILASLVNHQSVSLDVEKLKALSSLFLSQRNITAYDNDVLKKKLLTLAFATNFSILGEGKYKFKIKASDLYDVANDIFPLIYQTFSNKCADNSCFTFVVHMYDNNLQHIECTTPAISGRAYWLGIDFENDFRNVGLCVSDIASHRELFDINISQKNSEIFMDLDSAGFKMYSIYDISKSDLYSRFSVGNYQNIALRGEKGKSSYTLTAVFVLPSTDAVLNLKFLSNVSHLKKSVVNISTNKMTFGEIMKLQKELSYFCDLYIKQ